MKYHHSTIKIGQPAPGHYAVTGLPTDQVFVEGTGFIVAPGTLYISPGVPDDLLEAIMKDRAAGSPIASQEHPVDEDHPRRGPGRPPKPHGEPLPPKGSHA